MSRSRRSAKPQRRRQRSARHEDRASRPERPADHPGVSSVTSVVESRTLLLVRTVGVFALALALRLGHLWQIHSAPFFGLMMGDAESYDRWARALSAGDWIGSEVFYQAPLYPYVLGLVYTVFGDGALAIRLVQAGLGALACALLAAAGARILGPRAGLAAGLLLAVYPAAIFYDSLVQKASLAGVLLCALLWLLALLGTDRETGNEMTERGPGRSAASWLAPLGAGLVLGLLTLTRENAAVFVLLVAALLLVDAHRRRGRARFVPLLALAVGLGLVLLPVLARNLAVGGPGGGATLTTSQFGPNFYIGNNPRTDGRYVPLRPGRDNARFERTDAVELAEQALSRSLTPAEVSRYWTGQALEFIRSQPLAWGRLMLRKLALTWNAAEIDDTEDPYTYATWSAVLRTGGVLHFGLLAPLGALGIWLTRRDWRRLWILYGMLALYTTSVVLFFVFGRYRYPLVPVLLLFAGGGLTALPGWWRSSPARERLVVAVALALVALACNWPLVSRREMRANTVANFGVALYERGESEAAQRMYRQALEIEPKNGRAHYNYAIALAAADRLDEAIHHYRQSLEIYADHPSAHFNLANALVRRADLAGATRHYREALALDPAHASARLNLGVALKEQGRIEEAVQELRLAVQGAPDSLDAQLNLGMALGVAGAVEEAERAFERARELDPESAIARYNLGLARVAAGRLGAGLEELGAAARLEPEWPAPLDDLAWILATYPEPSARRPRDAVRFAERAAELTRYREPAMLDTLAAAYAAAGDFARAVEVAQRGAELSEQARASDLARSIRARLELYRRGQPFIDSGT